MVALSFTNYHGTRTVHLTFRSLRDMYKAYVIKHFGQTRNINIVFDGYGSSTKDHCHSKRSPFSGLQIDFLKETILQCKKEFFLSNSDNKQGFVCMLGEFLEGCGCTVSFSRAELYNTYLTYFIRSCKKRIIRVFYYRQTYRTAKYFKNTAVFFSLW